MATVVNMLWSISRAPVPGGLGLPATRAEAFPLTPALRALGTAIAEVFGQARYRDCGTEKTTAPAPLSVRRWLVHYAIMIGMIGLVVATALDYFFKTPGSHAAIWSPARLLGTVAGALLVYGTTVAVVQRLRKADKYTARSLLSDWMFLAFLWAIGLTGFILEVADYATLSSWVGVVFLVHIALAMELILLLPFTKLAHIVYRPLAIWFTEFRRLRAAQ